MLQIGSSKIDNDTNATNRVPTLPTRLSKIDKACRVVKSEEYDDRYLDLFIY